MPFCVAFIALLALTQVLRQAATGLSPFMFLIIVCLGSTILALLILRKHAAFVFGSPPLVEQSVTIDWSWQRSLFLVPVTALLLWGAPLAYGFSFGAPSLRTFDANSIVFALVVQVLLVALSEELFFREAGLYGWVQQPLTGLAVTSLAFFVFHLHLGVPQAVIALSAGLVYGSLRIAGAGVLAIVLLHGVTNVIFSKVLSLGLPVGGLPTYTLYFFCASLVLSFGLLRSRVQPTRQSWSQ